MYLLSPKPQEINEPEIRYGKDQQHFRIFRLIESYKLKPLQLLLVSNILSFCLADRICYATNGYFADKWGLTKTGISLALKKLSDEKLILIEGQGKRRVLKTGERLIPLINLLKS